jgi:hypothetical protein
MVHHLPATPHEILESRRLSTTAYFDSGDIFMTVDTGCERQVIGGGYKDKIIRRLNDLKMTAIDRPELEYFKFGDSVVHESHQRLTFPMSFEDVDGHRECVLGRSSVLDADIPLLMSKQTMMLTKSLLQCWTPTSLS